MPSAKPSTDAQVDHWKTRYLRGLDELEQKERQWAEVQHLLHKAVGRLAAVAAEAYPSLEPHLERLRAAARAGSDSRTVTGIAGDLADAALRLRPSEGGAVRPEKAMLALLDGLPIPTALSADVAALRRHLEAPAADQAGGERLTEMSRLLRRALVLATPAGDAPARGPGGAPVEVLVQLLERLELPPEDGPAVSDLRERLARPVVPGDLPALLDTVAELVRKMRRGLEDERRAFESFLKDVSERLSELGTGLAGSELRRHGSLQDARTLQEQVGQEVAVMRGSVDQASDLEGLKDAIRRGLTAVESRVAKHLRDEEQRQSEAETGSRAMAERLQRLEAETGRLRERVHQARAEAVRDRLTGLHNRLAYEERIAQEFIHWKRYRAPLALLVLDVDRFKALNDRFGHVAGDRALRALADRLVESVRQADFIARYGGEEFVVLMPQTDRAAAGTVAEKLRCAVEQCAFQYRDHPVSVTVSCGYTDFRDGDTPEVVFERADQALYRAKRGGRNRCEAG